VLLRWGSQRGEDHNFRHVINPIPALRNASDKLRAFQLMEAHDVPVPRFTTSKAEVEDHWDASVVLGRTRHGARGNGIVAYDDPRWTLGQHELYTEYIDNDREYRLHVVGDEIVRVQRKYLDFPEQRTSEYVKNYANGYRFRAPQRRLNHDREEAAIKAVKALGLHFGCVDMVIDREGVCYVLEVNTAPSCSPLTAGAYVGRLGPLIQEMTGREVITNYNVLNMLGPGEDADTEEP
jgi:glutathione synthase/RimK-type ligase-like ATP-grasp enzyme